MIIYDPNRNWWRDLAQLHKSETMRRVWITMLITGAATAVICLALDYFDLIEKLSMNSGVYSLLGIALSIVLVYRTNTAYDRWWEGRKQWGALVNNCRNLAVMLHATLPREDKETRKYFAKHISNFCIAFKEHLRDGVKLEELILLKPEEREKYETKNHVPNYISYQIFNRVEEAYRNGEIRDMDMLNIKPQVTALLDILGACERIKKTPIPFSYSIYIKQFIMLYGIVLPFGLVGSLGYWTILVVMLVLFAFVGLELMAEEVEDPFGHDRNDLPTATIAHNIKNNVFEILEARNPVKDKDYSEDYGNMP